MVVQWMLGFYGYIVIELISFLSDQETECLVPNSSLSFVSLYLTCFVELYKSYVAGAGQFVYCNSFL